MQLRKVAIKFPDTTVTQRRRAAVREGRLRGQVEKVKEHMKDENQELWTAQYSNDRPQIIKQ